MRPQVPKLSRIEYHECEIGAVVARVAVGYRQGVRIQIRRILPRHREGRRIHMHLPGADPEPLAGLARNPRTERRRVMGIQPVQRPSQAVVMQHLGRDAWAQQMLARLGREELGHQIQPAIAEPQPVEDHRDRRHADAHLLLGRPRQRIQILR